jgi:hypothetical protein
VSATQEGRGLPAPYGTEAGACKTRVYAENHQDFRPSDDVILTSLGSSCKR